jgi:hypothetical protein
MDIPVVVDSFQLALRVPWPLRRGSLASQVIFHQGPSVQ